MRRRDPLISEVAQSIMEDELGDAICYDELLGRICVCGKLPWEDGTFRSLRPWAAVDDSCGYAYVQEAFECASERDFQHALAIAADKRKTNSVIDTLDTLPVWDGTSSMGTLLTVFLGAKDDDYTREVERPLMSAALSRTLDPSCKFDYMPVLIGNQGIGKSTFIRKLTLDSRFYTDSIHGIGTKQAAELVQGKWFVELPELAAMRSAALESAKAFITRQADEYRMPYARHVECRPRRFVMVGTANVREFLSDLTGNRCFLPIRCGIREPEMSLFSKDANDHFQQAWAEAYQSYKEGAIGRAWQLTLTAGSSRQAMELQAESGIDDPRIGILSQWVEGVEPGSVICAVQTMEEALGIPREMQRRRDQMEVSALLQNSIPRLKQLCGKHRVGAYGVQRAFIVDGS